MAAPPHPMTPGRVWLLLGDKPGDNARIEAVVEALGWRCERKALHWRAPYDTEKPPFRVTVDHAERTQSAPLEPPWPDLVPTIGRRPSMAAQWIKEQSAGSNQLGAISWEQSAGSNQLDVPESSCSASRRA